VTSDSKDFRQAALDYHEFPVPGKLSITPTKQLINQNDLALAYSPGVAAACETVDVPYIADAEIVLEAEVLPTGWTHPEGRFGEFTWLMGGLHWNPIVRVKAVSMRRDAVYYSLHMPWENTWLMAPTRYTAIRQALRTAGVVVKPNSWSTTRCL